MNTELEAVLKEFDEKQNELIQSLTPRGNHTLFEQLYGKA
jgi:hypothetical protein